MKKASPKPTVIGYVLKRFPVLSETFVLNEILALESAGIPIHILSLERPNDPRFHPGLSVLKATVSYAPLPVEPLRAFRYVKKAFSRDRNKWIKTLLSCIKRGKPMLLWRFVQACYIAEEARRLKVRHLHAHFATRPTTVAQLAAQLSGEPYSFTAHAMDIYKSQLSTKALASKMAEATSIVTVSDYNQALLRQLVPKISERVVRIYNGIDTDIFVPAENDLNPVPFRIVSVARLVAKKGIPDLIEACRLLEERGIDFECLIIGKGVMRGALLGMIKDKGLRKRVKLLGPQTQGEVLDLLKQSHIYALPCIVGPDGNRDGLPVSIVEALSCGLPVVSTSVTGIPEAVIDGYNGRIIASGDPIALADAIEQLATDGEYFDSLRRNARPSVAAKFDMKKTSAELTRVLVKEAA